MYTATIATEEKCQKYGEKNLLKLTLYGYINNTDEPLCEFYACILYFKVGTEKLPGYLM